MAFFDIARLLLQRQQPQQSQQPWDERLPDGRSMLDVAMNRQPPIQAPQAPQAPQPQPYETPSSLDPNASDTLKVESQGLENLSRPPDTIAQRFDTPYKNMVDVPQMSLAAQNALLEHYKNYPTNVEPGFLQKLISSAAGGSAGYFGGPVAGLHAANEYYNTPYQRTLQRWGAEAAPLQAAATAENVGNKYGLDRAKIYGEVMKDYDAAQRGAYTATTEAQKAETGRFAEQTKTAAENRRRWALMHPEGQVATFETGPSDIENEVGVINRRTGEVKGTGLKGFPKFRPLSDLLRLSQERNKGLADLIRNIPERDTHAALENAYRSIGYRYPAKYGMFIDKNTGYLKPIDKIMSMIQDPEIKSLYDGFQTLVEDEASKQLSKFKTSKTGLTVKPNINVGPFTILNQDEEETQSEESQSEGEENEEE